ncbi:Ribosomal protein S18 acetylase RimI [Haladaptatus litoreus]|uniref:Ribosomal protein S18 acetylase RimI n=1 Tax=Haladaptatus litoreus TaxID=553468 RepID=A0A1N6WFE9_9EURY|nr:GNAT family N-acetyltransferase [Haladaptatus litoreus]SIQ88794.1 Ribosomal protein S18 acetylase RimI [Haladaptatus litoreus]
MNIREPTATDTRRVRELVESAMTTSYALSPQQIETLAEAKFGEEQLTRRIESSGTVIRVADSEEWDTIVGVVVAEREDETGEVRWLFVDPEHRGGEIGRKLFETATETLRELGARRLRATALESNTEGHQFFERFGFEETERRRVEVGDESLVEYVYEEPSSAGERTVDSEEADEGTDAAADDDFPNTESVDGETTVPTDDGRVYLDLDAEQSGTEGAFFTVYTDETHEEQFGYYCRNCGSLNVSMDTVERIECNECGNTHASRSTEEYDDSYL